MTIYCLPTGQFGLGIRGITVGRSYEDENSRVAPEIEEAIAPMLLTTGGARIKLSTPHGATGEFYNTWINKDGAYDSYTRFSVTSETVVTERKICKTWTKTQREGALRLIEQAKSRMSKMQFAQEFLGEFIQDLHRYFSDAWINKVCRAKRPERRIKSQVYGMGVDIARMGEDTSRFSIFMRTPEKLVQVELITTEKTLTTDTEDKIVELTKIWDLEKNYIDAGSGTLGVSVMDHLIKIDHMRNRMVAINNAQRIVEYDNDRNPIYAKLQKEDLYDNLRALGEQDRIVLLDDEEIQYELATIQYEYVQKAGQPTRLRIFSNPSADIVESLTRGAQFIKYKHLNLRVWSIKV